MVPPGGTKSHPSYHDLTPTLGGLRYQERTPRGLQGDVRPPGPGRIRSRIRLRGQTRRRPEEEDQTVAIHREGRSGDGWKSRYESSVEESLRVPPTTSVKEKIGHSNNSLPFPDLGMEVVQENRGSWLETRILHHDFLRKYGPHYLVSLSDDPTGNEGLGTGTYTPSTTFCGSCRTRSRTSST